MQHCPSQCFACVWPLSLIEMRGLEQSRCRSVHSCVMLQQGFIALLLWRCSVGASCCWVWTLELCTKCAGLLHASWPHDGDEWLEGPTRVEWPKQQFRSYEVGRLATCPYIPSLGGGAVLCTYIGWRCTGAITNGACSPCEHGELSERPSAFKQGQTGACCNRAEAHWPADLSETAGSGACASFAVEAPPCCTDMTQGGV